MQLDSLIIETRMRSGWSSIDLGFRFAQHFWLRSFVLYLVMAVPVYALTRFLPSDLYWLAFIILWWFKPVFERPILYLMSRELFSERMPFWRVLADVRLWFLPAWLRIISTRRLSTTRGMMAPVNLLEQPKPKAYSHRKSVLSRKFSSEATWLNIVLLHIESFFGFAALMLLEFIFPDAINFGSFIADDSLASPGYLDLVTVCIMAVIAPFYVAGGFMLYISRRVELEGWDIEIVFRDWVSREKLKAEMSTP